ncbi:unnamed protein product [Linum tenue]|uniref:Uncharacterized protein n=1 Tax=Linum tenue TaxID=586396 RepID=A0AAV0NMG6_9ROSI|nr:unnamed protein product [Linum tenue]
MHSSQTSHWPPSHS